MTKVTLVGAREELATSYGPGYLKMSTTTENKKEYYCMMRERTQGTRLAIHLV